MCLYDSVLETKVDISTEINTNNNEYRSCRLFYFGHACLKGCNSFLLYGSTYWWNILDTPYGHIFFFFVLLLFLLLMFWGFFVGFLFFVLVLLWGVLCVCVRACARLFFVPNVVLRHSFLFSLWRFHFIERTSSVLNVFLWDPHGTAKLLIGGYYTLDKIRPGFSLQGVIHWT